jgi:GDP-L-fucose synthase
MTVLVAGSTGLVGSAIAAAYESRGEKVIRVSRSIVDLTDSESTRRFLLHTKPTVVVDAAGKVGGIGVNNSYPVEFLTENIRIQSNLMAAAHEADVQKFIFLGSSCIYPRECAQPIREEYLLTGPLETTNSAYAIAKITGIELVNSYRKEFGHKWISLMPTNIYGPHDNFDLSSSHVVPALIRRFVEAVKLNSPVVTLWGSGSPLREFLHVDDLAQAVLQAGDSYDSSMHLNVGTGKDLSINELAQLISSLTDFQGEIFWDSTKPDGTFRKVLDISRIKALGWRPTITLESGLSSTIDWYKSATTKGEVRN